MVLRLSLCFSCTVNEGGKLALLRPYWKKKGPTLGGGGGVEKSKLKLTSAKFN